MSLLPISSSVVRELIGRGILQRSPASNFAVGTALRCGEPWFGQTKSLMTETNAGNPKVNSIAGKVQSQTPKDHKMFQEPSGCRFFSNELLTILTGKEQEQKHVPKLQKFMQFMFADPPMQYERIPESLDQLKKLIDKHSVLIFDALHIAQSKEADGVGSSYDADKEVWQMHGHSLIIAGHFTGEDSRTKLFMLDGDDSVIKQVINGALEDGTQLPAEYHDLHKGLQKLNIADASDITVGVLIKLEEMGVKNAFLRLAGRVVDGEAFLEKASSLPAFVHCEVHGVKYMKNPGE